MREKSARLAELNIALTMTEKKGPEAVNAPTPDNENTEQVKDTPSVDEQPDYDNAVNFRQTSQNEQTAHFGITHDEPVSERAIQDLKLIDGNAHIYLHPRTDGQQYRGEVLHVDEERGFCVQLSGKQSLFVHSLDNLERTPAKGENIKLAYPRENGRKAAVIHQEVAQARAHVRA